MAKRVLKLLTCNFQTLFLIYSTIVRNIISKVRNFFPISTIHFNIYWYYIFKLYKTLYIHNQSNAFPITLTASNASSDKSSASPMISPIRGTAVIDALTVAKPIAAYCKEYAPSPAPTFFFLFLRFLTFPPTCRHPSVFKQAHIFKQPPFLYIFFACFRASLKFTFGCAFLYFFTCVNQAFAILCYYYI